MKILSATIREICRATVDVFIDEPNMDLRVIITENGMCYKQNSVEKQKLNDVQIKILFDNSIKENSELTWYLVDSLEQVSNTNILDTYTCDSNFMMQVFNILIDSGYFSKKRLMLTLGINKQINDRLFIYLLDNGYVSPYSTYYRVTQENLQNISRACGDIKSKRSID